MGNVQRAHARHRATFFSLIKGMTKRSPRHPADFEKKKNCMAMPEKNTCIVLGNGPSLRGFDLHRLNGFDTLGMNAAYRHWDRIGWYPKYYACLDDQLIKTHHAEIERLYRGGFVEKVFVHDSFFDHHPHRIGHPDFTFFGQTSAYWYPQSAEKKSGLEPLYDLPAFRMSEPSKVTTGSHALRYVANLGYQKIALMGIDLRYVELIPEAETTEGLGLVIRSTPKVNPNYFFYSYQQAGDLYKIPNPVVHDGKLHERSFEIVPKDFSDNSVNCKIFTCNKESILSDKDIFPYLPIETLLQEDQLGCVFVPTNVREVDTILNNFKLWSLMQFSPAKVDRLVDAPALVFVFNNISGSAHEGQIRTAFLEYRMDRYFRDIVFEYLDLEGERDAYIRDYTKPVGAQGYKAGPNNQFFGAIRRVAGYGTYGFLMETDCLPIRRGWLEQLQDSINGSEPFWVMGSAYRGLHTLGKDYIRHINGNAVYAVGNPKFQTFLTDFWEYHTFRLIETQDKRLAYDCILEIMFSDPAIREPKITDVWKNTAHLFRYTGYIQNISGDRDLAATTGDTASTLRVRCPETFILHNRAAHKLAVAEFAADVVPFTAPTALNPAYPKILLLDATAMGNGTATGEVKSTLLADWPASQLLQIAHQGPHGLALVERSGAAYPVVPVDLDGARKQIAEFAPDLILYRPVPDTTALHSLAMDYIAASDLPLVTWLMDDWPARMEHESPADWALMQPDLDHLLKRSKLRLSICEAMSDAFARRYGQPFVPLANGIDPGQWPEVAKPSAQDGMFRLRYAGGLATDMNRKSILQIAEAVERIARSGTSISFQIVTQQWWLDQVRDQFTGLRHTRLQPATMTDTAYRGWISQADALVIAYNFDEASLRYIRYSMANKMPECLISHAPLLAYGPGDAATIRYLADGDLARIVSTEGVDEVEAALRSLIADPQARTDLSGRAQAAARNRHDVRTLRHQLRTHLRHASTPPTPDPTPAHTPVLQTATPSQGTPVHPYLLGIARELLLQPQALLERLRRDSVFRQTLETAMKTLPGDDRLLHHVQKTLDRARLIAKV